MGTLAVICLLTCSVAIMALRPFSRAVGLLDRPGGRKTHEGHVPLVGGLGMFIAVAVGMWLMPATDIHTPLLIGACALLVGVGVVDDRFDIAARGRLIVQLVAALIVILALGTDLALSFGRAFGTSQALVLSGLPAIAASLLLIGGAINAFNMIDGMDGLAGSMAFIALAGFGWLATHAHDAYTAQVCFIALGATAGFLMFNLPLVVNRPWRVFMGDAGSTLLGFLTAIVALRLTQGPAAVAPVTVLWLAALPVCDLLVTVLRRILGGRSPFHADRGHFHHRLADAGLTAPATLLVLCVTAACLALAGLWMHAVRVPEALQLGAFFGVMALLAFASSTASRWTAFLPAWSQKER
ncbi:undecaprenyl/decaprenyl-phosphate alpha-N-acetylglucosaminyl 1-phosphate transferase [Calidifontimicrobium sp. SYSU G02091]|uniref:undecaprenyl/decaprenyl-phosphate alpha-N-acetylglucosaminyl 1-phosphate transferase n=1 Tax=Calidifontimicrobium sp. SYSU G02091 TaxID=2926421 RepID=UPI001F53CB90|nr:undecaprenyl/decaprenyl-phosphate alpha-N-acetylglucosaminyl 1-phosphate transferase [Calidifontimicrobium sp. SYSU G02091]MCI1192191.1 undecaprenyl/decaprenyl-phosphate alpha-N-acetylglucosaminyl 1-phosphate transferase [Calidifontimicrobium sp. SYSU G02091]